MDRVGRRFIHALRGRSLTGRGLSIQRGLRDWWGDVRGGGEARVRWAWEEWKGSDAKIRKEPALGTQACLDGSRNPSDCPALAVSSESLAETA